MVSEGREGDERESERAHEFRILVRFVCIMMYTWTQIFRFARRSLDMISFRSVIAQSMSLLPNHLRRKSACICSANTMTLQTKPTVT